MSTQPVLQDQWPWQVSVRWAPEAEQGGPWVLMIRPHPDATEDEIAGGLSSTVLRQVDFQGAATKWRTRHQRIRKPAADKQRQDKLSKDLRLAMQRGINVQYLARLSEIYVDLVRRGEPRVTETLASMIDRKPETVKAHLKDARRRKLLSTVPGRAGGRLTELAIEALRVN